MAVGKVKWGNIIGSIVVLGAIGYGSWRLLDKAPTPAEAQPVIVQSQQSPQQVQQPMVIVQPTEPAPVPAKKDAFDALIHEAGKK